MPDGDRTLGAELGRDGERSVLRRVARRLVPQRARQYIAQAFMLSGRARGAYVAQSLRRMAGMTPSVEQLVQSPTCRVLFVCHGNIIRSALAAELLAAQMPPARSRIASAGTHAIAGRPADPRAQAIAIELGISLANHRAQPLTAALIQNADCIIAMDRLNEASILAMDSQAHRKLLLLGSLSAASDRVEIADPYADGLEEVRACATVIADAIQRLAAHLEKTGTVPRT